LIEYITSADDVEPADLEGFFVDWPRRPAPEKHLALLRGSSHVVLACEGRRVVGFVTAVSDGVLSAYIPLLEVLPDFQGRGIGKELTRRLLVALDGLYMVDVVCDEDVAPFYAALGLTRLDAALGLRNRAAV
jgi:ribosomal protein S18 acetylase RimI-like enzyme